MYKIRFDLVVFDTLFLCKTRWESRNAFRRSVEKVRDLKHLEAVRIALPQDEFFSTDLLCDFINEMGIDVVFSVAPPSEWPQIYSIVDREKVAFYHVLPGYLDDRVVAKVGRLSRGSTPRTIDVGYRTSGRPLPWFGRHGYLKQQIAEVFQEEVPKRDLVADISTRAEDVILGDRWYKFLLRCKYVIGVEGGTSILDRDGSLASRTKEYLAAYPHASFEEVEQTCFPGVDGLFHLVAVSPRHLEACVTRTCQILTAGDYGGVLEPGKHYIELAKDFSNLDEVLTWVSEDRRRAEMTEQAYRDVVLSGRYTYQQFVQFVLKHSLPQLRGSDDGDFYLPLSKVGAHCRYVRWAWLADRFSWIKVMAYVGVKNVAKWLLKRLLPADKALQLFKAWRSYKDRY